VGDLSNDEAVELSTLSRSSESYRGKHQALWTRNSQKWDCGPSVGLESSNLNLKIHEKIVKTVKKITENPHAKNFRRILDVRKTFQLFPNERTFPICCK
jgi:hypothetical protein